MSYIEKNASMENHLKQSIPHKKRQIQEQNNPKNIIYTDKSSFDEKLSNFIDSYYRDKKSVAIVTDFDYTLTSRIDYKTGKLYHSSYYLYDEDIIGGDQKTFDQRRQALADKYALYEFSTSYDIETRKIKMKEWYTKSLELYFNEKFTADSVDEMVHKTKNNLLLRRKAIEYLELLMNLGITVVIESGGIGDFIRSYLKIYLPNFERYLNEKKIIIVSNMFTFDNKAGCVGLEHEVINCFNKADFLGNVVNEELPELKHVMVLGDNLSDADSIKKINVPKENVIGFGFLNLPSDIINDETKKDYLQKKINENKKVFDMTLLGDCDYDPIIEILKNIRVHN